MKLLLNIGFATTLALLVSCGQPARLVDSGSGGNKVKNALDTPPSLNVRDVNGAIAPLSSIVAPAFFSQANAELGGASPDTFFTKNYGSFAANDDSIERGVVIPGTWMLSLQTLGGDGSRYEISALNTSAATIIRGVGCDVPAAGYLPSNGLLTLCLNAQNTGAAYYAGIGIRILRPNRSPVVKNLLLAVVSTLPNVAINAPTCGITLSGGTVTLGQQTVATVTVSGPATAAFVNGRPISLPMAQVPIVPANSKSSLGTQTFSAVVVGSGNIQPTTCTVSYTVNPAVMTAQLCESNNGNRTECTYAGVGEIIAITNVVRTGAASCKITNQEYGIAAPNKLFTDKRCKGKFDFTYVPGP